MSSTRRHFSAEQKAQIVRRHLSGKEAVSDLADELKIQPSGVVMLWMTPTSPGSPGADPGTQPCTGWPSKLDCPNWPRRPPRDTIARLTGCTPDSPIANH